MAAWRKTLGTLHSPSRGSAPLSKYGDIRSVPLVRQGALQDNIDDACVLEDAQSDFPCPSQPRLVRIETIGDLTCTERARYKAMATLSAKKVFFKEITRHFIEPAGAVAVNDRENRAQIGRCPKVTGC